MKRLITFLVAVFYLAVSSGIALQVHYCMDEVAAFTLLPADSDKCDTCGMKGNSCCRNEITFIKLQDAHKQPVIGFEAQSFVSVLPEKVYAVLPAGLVLITKQRFSGISPPPELSRKKYVLHCRYNV
jgi:hypothetical protein